MPIEQIIGVPESLFRAMQLYCDGASSLLDLAKESRSHSSKVWGHKGGGHQTELTIALSIQKHEHLSDLREFIESHDFEKESFVQSEQDIITQEDALLSEAAASNDWECSQCGHHKHKPEQKQLQAIELAGPDGSREYGSIEIATIECEGCSSTYQTPQVIGTRRRVFCELLSKRLLLDLPIERTDMYETLDELYKQMVYSGSLLLEALQELCLCIDDREKELFDSHGVYTGKYILDRSDEWEIEVFTQLESLGLIENVGGLVYVAAPHKDRTSPFSSRMITNETPGAAHQKGWQ